MSRYDYENSRKIYGENHSFYSLIMAAMRGADSENLNKLKRMWPGVWVELDERYNSPGGMTNAEWAEQQAAVEVERKQRKEKEEDKWGGTGTTLPPDTDMDQP